MDKEIAFTRIDNFVQNYLKDIPFFSRGNKTLDAEGNSFYKEIKLKSSKSQNREEDEQKVELWFENWGENGFEKYFFCLAVVFTENTLKTYIGDPCKSSYYKKDCWDCEKEDVQMPEPGKFTLQKTEGFCYLSLYIEPGTERESVVAFFENNEVKKVLGLDNDQVTERWRQSLARIGQGKYRIDMLREWGDCCAVTGCNVKETIIASHAKPWRIANPEEKTDWHNGLPLSANLDALFDKGLITFDKDWKIVIPESRIEEFKKIGVKKGMAIQRTLSEDDQQKVEEFLEYHRSNIYVGG